MFAYFRSHRVDDRVAGFACFACLPVAANEIRKQCATLLKHSYRTAHDLPILSGDAYRAKALPRRYKSLNWSGSRQEKPFRARSLTTGTRQRALVAKENLFPIILTTVPPGEGPALRLKPRTARHSVPSCTVHFCSVVLPQEPRVHHCSTCRWSLPRQSNPAQRKCEQHWQHFLSFPLFLPHPISTVLCVCVWMWLCVGGGAKKDS